MDLKIVSVIFVVVAMLLLGWRRVPGLNAFTVSLIILALLLFWFLGFWETVF